MARLLEMTQMIQKNCACCGASFSPKPMGYNALYCSARCKLFAGRARLLIDKPEQLKAARARSYQRTKKDPERLAVHRKNGRAQRSSVRQWLSDYKTQHGCVDCGYNTHPAALQLDHEGVKSVAISEARSSIARLKKEIEDGQCKVRCANCHAVKTWQRKQNPSTDGQKVPWRQYLGVDA